MSTLAEQLVRRKRELEELEEKVKQAKKSYDDLAKLVTEDFVIQGVTKIGLVVDGRKCTVSRRRNFMCNVLAGDRPKLVEALRRIGYGDLVEETINTGKLKAWLKELIAPGDREDDDDFDLDAIPPEIRPLVRTYQDVVPVIVNR